jgi:hypothetical protein
MPSAANSVASIPTSSRAAGSRATARNPSAVAASVPPRAVGAGAADRLTRATISPPPRVAPAMIANTVPGPASPSTTPVIPGATSTLTLSFQPEITFAAVKSSGRRATAGRSTAWVGRVTVTAVAANAAQATARTGGPWVNKMAAVAAIPRGLREVPGREDEDGRVPVGQHRHKRSADRRGQELRECGHTGCGRAASLVGVDEHRDPDGPFGAVEGRVRDLHAA